MPFPRLKAEPIHSSLCATPQAPCAKVVSMGTACVTHKWSALSRGSREVPLDLFFFTFSLPWTPDDSTIVNRLVKCPCVLVRQASLKQRAPEIFFRKERAAQAPRGVLSAVTCHKRGACGGGGVTFHLEKGESTRKKVLLKTVHPELETGSRELIPVY